MNTRDIIYTAGIIDGEGCIGLYSRGAGYKRRFRPRATVTNTSKDLVMWLKEKWGGSVSFYKSKRINRKDCYGWHLSTADTLRLIKAILPYLIVKSKQCELVLKYESITKKYHIGMGRPAKNSLSGKVTILIDRLAASSKVLNKRGRA